MSGRARAGGRGVRTPGRAAGAVRPAHPRTHLRRRTEREAAPRPSPARVGDVINVAGHQLSAKHLEAAALTVEDVAEAAAVPVHDPEHGWLIEMYVVLEPPGEPDSDTVARITTAIERETGRIAGPKNVWIIAGMPKTRTGEIMRHVLAAISNFTDVGDTGTPATDIQRHVHAAKLERGEKPAKLTPKQIEEIRAFGRPD